MKDSFTLKTGYWGSVVQMTDEEAGQLFKAILAYSCGNAPDPYKMSGNARLLFPLIASQIDEDNNTKKARSSAGKTAANARWQCERNADVCDRNATVCERIEAHCECNANASEAEIAEENEEAKEENGKESTKEKDKGEREEDKEELNTLVGIYSEVGCSEKEKEKGVPTPLSNNNGTPEKTKNPLPEKPPDPKEGSPLFRSPLVREAWEEYRQMRIRIRKPFTGMAEARRVYDLEQLSKGNTALAVKILNQSVDNCWVGLFELKEPQKTKADRYREEWENA